MTKVGKAKLLVEKEGKSTGTVPLRVYWFYFMSGGGLGAMLLVFFSNIALPSAWFFQNWSLGEWMKSVEMEDAHQPTRQRDLMIYLVSEG